MNGHPSTTPERLGDLCDGTYFSSHTLFQAKPQSLQVYLYYDDVEVCNPLGSSRGKHKLGNTLCKFSSYCIQTYT